MTTQSPRAVDADPTRPGSRRFSFLFFWHTHMAHSRDKSCTLSECTRMHAGSIASLRLLDHSHRSSSWLSTRMRIVRVWLWTRSGHARTKRTTINLLWLPSWSLGQFHDSAPWYASQISQPSCGKRQCDRAKVSGEHFLFVNRGWRLGPDSRRTQKLHSLKWEPITKRALK
jgi:hypothetical protein